MKILDLKKKPCKVSNEIGDFLPIVKIKIFKMAASIGLFIIRRQNLFLLIARTFLFTSDFDRDCGRLHVLVFQIRISPSIIWPKQDFSTNDGSFDYF